MIDLPTFSAVSIGINQTIAFTKGLLDLKISTETAARINEVVIQLGEIAGRLAVANATLLEHQDKTKKLEEQLKSTRAFVKEKKRYALNDLGTGAFCYTLKESASGGEPIHSICCNCIGENKKSILQFLSSDSTFTTLVCPRCKSEIRYPHRITKTPRPPKSNSGMQGY